jgi:hypothetical protein
MNQLTQRIVDPNGVEKRERPWLVYAKFAQAVSNFVIHEGQKRNWESAGQLLRGDVLTKIVEGFGQTSIVLTLLASNAQAAIMFMARRGWLHGSKPFCEGNPQ